ncbi:MULTISPECIES: TonB family protein [unclassified Agarivorans]|uniref:energy transducer TonB n=1 Tax=unclassified Agarivorans TaxID=2636026 RepID=UPI003D7EF819
MLRLLAFSPLGILFASSFFWALAHLAGIGQTAKFERSEAPHLSFLAVKQDSDVEHRLRERQKPPEPELEAVPELPPMPSQTLSQAPQPKIDLNLPSISSTQVAISSVSNLIHIGPPAPVAVTIDRNPMALSRVSPIYPRSAERRKIEGKVTVHFTVKENGEVAIGSIKVVKSDPKGVFEASVKQALMRWRFQVKTENGKAVSFRALQTFEFTRGD